MSAAESKRDKCFRSSRRDVLRLLGAMGVGSVVFRRALAADVAGSSAVTAEMIRHAEWIAGLELTNSQRADTARALQRLLPELRKLRSVPLDNGVPPALVFRPAPEKTEVPLSRETIHLPENPVPVRPASGDELAFLTVRELARLLRARKVSSVELTKLYLKRLRDYDPALHCVVTYTDDLALKQAAHADRELATGLDRGPLHGMPWGAKDLISVPGYKTTWGAAPFKDQILNIEATVARRLREAGAVLVAKLSMGALAMGDHWFGGVTRSPWDTRQGSSGSSAGSAAATSAGLVGFALGTETLGSIVSPCRQCGVSGLRPTFGRVSRHGCMALAWSMDKIGPIARSLEDCALVFNAIHGADGLDPSAVTQPFHWPSRRGLHGFRVGYVDNGKAVSKRDELRVLRDLGVKLVPIELPTSLPVDALELILTVEAATAFDDLTRKGVTEGLGAWPNIFRQGQFISAVDYLRANRVRTLLMRRMAEVMANVDAYVDGRDLLITNLTGHPSIVLPNGMVKRNGVQVPGSLTFTGKLYGETDLVALGQAYQEATGYHRHHPPMDGVKPAALQERWRR